jgi:hypothetical protein
MCLQRDRGKDIGEAAKETWFSNLEGRRNKRKHVPKVTELDRAEQQ